MPRLLSAPLGAALLTATLATPALAQPADDAFRILHAERVALEGLQTDRARAAAAGGETATPPAAASDGAAGPPVRFEAYGRRFELELERNARLAPALAGLPGAPAVWRGELAGQPGSWVRLTVANGRAHGMVWDGRDLYVIEPATDAQPHLVNAPVASSAAAARTAGTAADTVVYRLSDTLVPEGSALCGVRTLARPAGERNGLEAYRRLVGELQDGAASGTASAPPTANATAPTRRLQVTAVADYELSVRVGVTGARDRVVARFNSIDGIFSEQVGVQIELLGVPVVFQTPQQPFSSSTANTLLEQVGTYRQSLSPRGGLTHLVTGRDLEGTTVGIAYIGALCSTRFGVSLSENSGSFSELIAAHEIGHNFGAPHDGEDACATTPADRFLMAPRVNGSRTFSDCSLAQMRTQLATAQCLLPPSTAVVDLAVGADPPPADAVAGTPFTVRATLASVGDAATSNVRLRYALPAGVTALDGTATNGGACATEAGGIACTWAAFDAGASAAVAVRLRADAAGSYPVSLQSTAPGDASTGNDTAGVTVVVAAAVAATNPAPTPAPATPVATPPASGGGGGGGAFDYAALLALFAAALLRLSGARGRY